MTTAAIIAFLMSPAGQGVILLACAGIGALFHTKISTTTADAIAKAAPQAVAAVEQVAKKGASNDERFNAAAAAVKAAVPFVGRYIVPGVKAQIETAVEAAVLKLPSTAAQAAAREAIGALVK